MYVTFVPKNFNVTHFTAFHFISLNFKTKSLHINHVSLVHITSLLSELVVPELNKELPAVCGTLRVRWHVQNERVACHCNRSHINPLNPFASYFNIILTSAAVSSNWSAFPSGFQLNPLYEFVIVRRATCPAHLIVI